MFKLENISKLYKPRRGTGVQALKDISLTLPDKGMVFLCGRSGSGKSTLMNILGGLDKPTRGEIDFNDILFSNLSEEELAEYRNNIVGFVFQDYNLIDNISIEENIKLPLDFQNYQNKHMITDALKKVGLEGYEKRRTNEMSGGEKQRAAIARALVKNPQIVLADEPTGNLDYGTGKEIFALLKELSKNCLVVVVTHDLESAKLYADFIIALADGRIVYNNCPAFQQNTDKIEYNLNSNGQAALPKTENDLTEVKSDLIVEALNKPLSQKAIEKKEIKDYITVETKKSFFTWIKTSMPFNIAFKIGAGNIVKRPIRIVVLILIAILAIFCINISQFFITYSSAKTRAKIIKDNNIDVFSLTQQHSEDMAHYTNLPIKFSAIDMIKSRYPDLSYYFSYKEPYSYSEGIPIKSSQDIFDFGYDFIGSYSELNEDSCYITDLYLDEIYNSGRYYLEITTNYYIKLLKSEYPPETIAGKKIGQGHAKPNNEIEVQDIIIISGIINTKDLFTENDRESFLKKYVLRNSKYFEQTINHYVNIYNIFLKADSSSYFTNKSLEFLTSAKECVVMADGTLTTSPKLNMSEVIINFDVYKKLFNVTMTKHDYVNAIFNEDSYEFSLRQVPEHLNTKARLTITEKEFNKNAVQTELIIAGVAFDFTTTDSKDVKEYIVFHNEDLAQSLNILNVNEIIINTNSVKNLKEFLQDMEKFETTAVVQYVDILEKIELEFRLYRLIFIALSTLLIIITFLFIVNSITLSILNRTKEIGIFKALGAKNKDLFTMFFAEAFILSFIIFVISIFLTFAGIAFLNYNFMAGHAYVFKMFTFNFWSVLTVFISSFGLIFLATLLPLLKIRKMNPIEAIRTIN